MLYKYFDRTNGYFIDGPDTRQQVAFDRFFLGDNLPFAVKTYKDVNGSLELSSEATSLIISLGKPEQQLIYAWGQLNYDTNTQAYTGSLLVASEDLIADVAIALGSGSYAVDIKAELAAWYADSGSETLAQIDASVYPPVFEETYVLPPTGSLIPGTLISASWATSSAYAHTSGQALASVEAISSSYADTATFAHDATDAENSVLLNGHEDTYFQEKLTNTIYDLTAARATLSEDSLLLNGTSSSGFSDVGHDHATTYSLLDHKHGNEAFYTESVYAITVSKAETASYIEGAESASYIGAVDNNYIPVKTTESLQPYRNSKLKQNGAWVENAGYFALKLVGGANRLYADDASGNTSFQLDTYNTDYGSLFINFNTAIGTNEVHVPGGGGTLASAKLQMNGAIMPTTSAAYTLGHGDYKWSAVYATNFYGTASWSTSASNALTSARSDFAMVCSNSLAASSSISSSYADSASQALMIPWAGITHEPTGFEEDNKGTFVLSSSAATATNRNITLSISGSFNIWSSGTKIAKTGSSILISEALPFVNYYVVFDATGSMLASTSSWEITNNPALPTAVVYHNGTYVIVFDERHGMIMDSATHDYFHDTFGCQYISGLSGTFNTTSSTNPGFVIGAGQIRDEDIIHTIAEQKACKLFYRTGSNFTFEVGSDKIYKKNGSNILSYDNNGTLTPCSVNNHMAVWIFAGNSTNYPIFSIIGQREDATLNNAIANNTYASLNLGNLPFKEFKLLYRVILQRSGTNVTYIQTDQYLSNQNASGGSYTPTSHGTLAGLTNDDHMAYARLTTRGTSQSFEDPMVFNGGLTSTSASIQNISSSAADLILRTTESNYKIKLSTSNGNISIRTSQASIIFNNTSSEYGEWLLYPSYNYAADERYFGAFILGKGYSNSNTSGPAGGTDLWSFAGDGHFRPMNANSQDIGSYGYYLRNVHATNFIGTASRSTTASFALTAATTTQIVEQVTSSSFADSASNSTRAVSASYADSYSYASGTGTLPTASMSGLYPITASKATNADTASFVSAVTEDYFLLGDANNKPKNSILRQNSDGIYIGSPGDANIGKHQLVIQPATSATLALISTDGHSGVYLGKSDVPYWALGMQMGEATADFNLYNYNLGNIGFSFKGATNDLYIRGSVIPYVDNTKNLGSTSYRFNTIYSSAITSSLHGTASWATNAVSAQSSATASFIATAARATSASYADIATVASTAGNANFATNSGLLEGYSAAYFQTQIGTGSSFNITSARATSASYALTSTQADSSSRANSASYASNSGLLDGNSAAYFQQALTTASVYSMTAARSVTASRALYSETSAISDRAASASLADTASYFAYSTSSYAISSSMAGTILTEIASGVKGIWIKYVCEQKMGNLQCVFTTASYKVAETATTTLYGTDDDIYFTGALVNGYFVLQCQNNSSRSINLKLHKDTI